MKSALASETETIPRAPGSTHNVGIHSEFVVDKRGHLHIAYRDIRGQLNYATNASGRWIATEITRLPETSSTNTFAIATDSNNDPYIVYTRVNSMGLLVRKGGVWHEESIENSGPVDETEISALIDSQNVLHTLYFLRFNGHLRYAKRIGDLWEIITIADTGKSFGNRSDFTNSIFMDENDKLHIGFTGREGKLQYATNESGSWLTTALTTTSLHPQLSQKDYMIFPGGIVHIAASINGTTNDIAGCIPTAQGLSYVTNLRGSLECEQLVDIQSLSQGVFLSYAVASPSITISEQGDIYISYTLIHYPNSDPAYRFHRIHYINLFKKAEEVWSEFPLESDGFETTSSVHDIQDGLGFSRTRTGLDGSPITTFFNGNLGLLQINHVLPEQDTSIPEPLNILLIKIADEVRKE